MNRTDILDKARGCVCGDRDHDYGGPEKSFETIATLWNGYLNARDCMSTCITTSSDFKVTTSEVCITPADVAAMMALMKIARIAKSPAKADSWIDLAGYAACGGECAAKESMVGTVDITTEAEFNERRFCSLCRNFNQASGRCRKEYIPDHLGEDPHACKNWEEA